MKILAMDIATSTGCAIGLAGQAPTAFSVDLGEPPDERRFSNILRLTNAMLSDHKPALVAIEAPIGGKDANAYLIGLVACVRGMACNHGVASEVMFAASVRKHFLGKHLTARDFPLLSKAKAKAAIKAEVVKRCELLGWKVPDHDAADAAALWDYACATKAGVQSAPGGRLFHADV